MVDRISSARAPSVAPTQTPGQGPDSAGKTGLADEMVGLATTRRSVQAQTKTMKAQNEILGTIIDIKA